VRAIKALESMWRKWPISQTPSSRYVVSAWIANNHHSLTKRSLRQVQLAKRKASELESFETTTALAAKRLKTKEQEEAEVLINQFLDKFQQIPIDSLAPQEAVEQVAALRAELLDSSSNTIVRSLLPAE
jgi:hypothetical protein